LIAPVRLVVLTGPIGAGKSSVAELLARRVARSGRPTAVADLDDVAFMQRGRIDLDEFWRRAGVAHAALVRSWFASGTDLVVAHGPFFEARSYDSLFATCPDGGRILHVLLRVAYDEALARVSADPDRAPEAMSRDPEFLRSTHETFAALEPDLPAVDLAIDTDDRSPSTIADGLVETVSA
jgi:hypothetical protein